MARSKTATVQLKLRLREDVRRRIEQEAKKGGRSLNQEMVHRLEQSFAQTTANAMLEKVKEERDIAVELLTEARRLMKELQELEVLPRAIAAAREQAKRLEKAKK